MIFLPLSRRFSFLIANRLIRDNLWTIIMKYPTFLIGGDLVFFSNTDSLGYQSFKGASWALASGLHLGDAIRGLLLVLGPFLIPTFRLSSWVYVPIILNPISCPPPP